ncbi:MAG: SDR family NAD(P)-dependent oxidoreductase [Polaribacter sp.]|jgi:NAD(P)-dependent dehydrogenase (short-subunit alcohol dehydrogenase family)|nr:SDR family oxidoreductase [Polaribacter sp.]MDA9257582.1 SDR family oxidoreductase [bacterium]MBT4780387.1 SDR family oxidoreductase [Polaribacter sp.]MBT5098848.1 SDR family oxidoreductase [Polaribacter sp.]MBT5645436.1 SDR family oxidoreductase [Polaribacter sp.]MBT7705310.1 SDR family oxidoreductase [Polaribacter sp.]
MEVKNKIVIVTGAGSGIGKATAIHFAKFGATVVVSDRQEAAAKEVVKIILEEGGKAISIPADVTSFEAVENLVAQTVKEFGRLDVIVNNAGIGPNLLRTHQSTLKDWDKVIAVNQTGVFYCMKVALVQFLKQGGGNIVNIASLAGLKASPNNISYSASKFAVVGMTKSVAMEYATKNIRVNAVCPGYTESALLTQLINAKPEMDAVLKSVIPMKRYGRAEEIADAVVWLASDNTQFMTGQTITLDGGTSL